MHFIKAKSLLSAKNCMNIYRGCTHGCVYCDSRNERYNMNHDFTDVAVKENAVQLLESELSKRKNKCMITTGAMSDPYIHAEEKLGLTRACLEIIEQKGFGLAIQTKSNRILRDIDLLEKINNKSKCVVQITMTSFDESICRKVEPCVCTTKERFEILKEMKNRGIPTIVWLMPILPYINDNEENINGILSYCKQANVKGILSMGMSLTLRQQNREYFYKSLNLHFHGLKEKYINQYGNSYELKSKENEKLTQLLIGECQKNNIMYRPNDIFSYMHQYPQAENFEQLKLF